MNNILITTAVLFVLIGAFTLWVLPAKDWRRIVGPIMLVIVFLAQCAAALTGLGQAVPSWFVKTYRNYDNAIVYTYFLREPIEIDLLVFIDGDLAPTLVAFPWDIEMAKALIKEFEEAAKSGETVELHPGDMMPYRIKPKPLPNKEGHTNDE